MNPIQKQSDIINAIVTSRKEWDNLLVKCGQEQMTQPGVCGEWSIQDIIAHITWFEREMAGVMEAHALTGSDLWNLPPDERNHAIYELSKGRPLNEVISESEQVFSQLLAHLETISDEDLIDPGSFPGMPPNWQPWKIIAENTYEHYIHHMPQIEAWLDKNPFSLRKRVRRTPAE